MGKGCFVLVAILLTACASSPRYTADCPIVHVQPSKGWRKPGVTGEEAYQVRQQCKVTLGQDSNYIRLKAAARSVQITLDMPKSDRERLSAGSIYAGSYMDACMKQEGFTHGKLASDQVYVPPPPPRKGWVKPGVNYVQAHEASMECHRAAESRPEFEAASKQNHYQLHTYVKSYAQACMTKQGFVYRELLDDELPPCSYVMFPPCLPDGLTYITEPARGN